MTNFLGDEPWIHPNITNIVLLSVALVDAVMIYYICKSRTNKKTRHIYNENFQEILPLPELGI